MLRRVEADLVSVFVATSRPCEISLLLLPGGTVIARELATDDLRALWTSTPTATLALGPHLHVAVVTLDLRAPGGNAVRSGGPLRAHEDHSYDLLFRWSDGRPPDNLRTLGLLEDPVPLGYDRHKLPGFRTCPDAREDLVIVHGSCRRMFNAPPLSDESPALDGPFPPPGGWPTAAPKVTDPEPTEADPFPSTDYPTTPRRDGLLWVDALIDPRVNPQRFAGRPHQLFLTGDQIYADDVPGVVLPALSHVGRALTGDEFLALDPRGLRREVATLQNFPPDFRKDTVLKSAGFSTVDGESHLLTFGEFCAYYVLNWSPALWDADPWPNSPELDPANFLMPDDWKAALLETQVEYAELVAHLPAASDDERAQRYFESQVRYRTAKYWSPELFEWWMRRFRQGLARVRRVLANVPTYMLADDHEVTDDWYLSRRWRDMVFTRPLGVSIVRNGLASYLAFQGWGNDPRRFAEGANAQALQAIQSWVAAPPAARTAVEDTLHELLGLPFQRPNVVPSFRPLVELSYQVEGPCHRVLVLDGRTKRRFPARSAQAGGLDFEGPTGLFGESPLAAALPPRPFGDTKLVLVVAGVPVLGPEGMELALRPFQRLARLLLDVDAEAWSYEPETYEALLWALARQGSVVVLSGDIHMGFTALLDYWNMAPGEPVQTARIVQLVSSGLTQTWGPKTPALLANALLHDVLEAGTTPDNPAERVGFGEPVRTAFTPPRDLSQAVNTGTSVAHPTYRERMGFRAPVVPTRGWPAGTVEAQPPSWAWRMVMVRDERPEATDDPNIDRRYTPALMPADPISGDTLGWHADNAQRMAFGRTFAFQPNVGVVTFEGAGQDWSVRHVIAGELQAMADTGRTPVGLQPYVVHRVSLTPPDAARTEQERPKIQGDGAWGVDTTDPTLMPLLEWLPYLWRLAAGHVSPLWPELPLNLDEAGRQALITEGADSLSAPFRRRVLAELGPFAHLRDDPALDAVTDQEIAALQHVIGPWSAQAEARALVRADVERLFDLHKASRDPISRAAFFDDALLLACSEWVNERASGLSTIAGLLATFRAPLTKRVPVLGGLLAGLWQRWRDKTYASSLTEYNVGVQLIGGALQALHRSVIFAVQLIREFIQHLPRDFDPREGGGPPIFPPELALAGLGAFMSLKLPKRVTTVSGFQTTRFPLIRGIRRGDDAPLTRARQTLSVLIHPGDQARYAGVAQKLSLTLFRGANVSPPGHVLVAWDGTFRLEGDLGGGVLQRAEVEGRAWFDQPWAFEFAPQPVGIPAASARFSILRPTTLNFQGVELKLTPKIELELGFHSAGGLAPIFELRVGLNDREDTVRFRPTADGVLSRLLPSDGLDIPLDLSIAWSPKDGWRFLGLGQAAEMVIEERHALPVISAQGEQKNPQKKKLGRFTLEDPAFGFGHKADGPDATKAFVTAKAAVSLDLGKFRIGVMGVGLELGLRAPNVPPETEDHGDFYSEFPPISGLALSIDVKALSGGGFLQRIESPGGGVTWRGALDLKVGKRLRLTAFAVVESSSPEQHWSMVAMLAGRLDPAVPLPWGLRLTAVGGILALHRRMAPDAIRDAAQSPSGSIDALLLNDRPSERFLEMIPLIDQFFPRAEGHHVFGPLVEIEWGKGGKSVGRLRAALLLELGDFKLGMFGTLQLGFPTLSEDTFARIRASFEALIDSERGIFLLSATLIECRVLKTINLTGGAAIYFSNRELAITAGGFHPSFRPFIPEGLREPPRIGFPWHPVTGVSLDIQAYIAITGSSFQFGASAYLLAGTSWGGIKGDLAFDFIVLTHPHPHLEIDLSCRVSIWLFGVDLLTVGLKGKFSGPHRWRLEGTVYWEVCGADVSKDFGPWEWGTPPATSTVTQSARALLGDALAEPSAWSTQRPAQLPVRLRLGTEGALLPKDVIEVRQAELPLGVPLEVHDRNPLSDGGTWSLAAAGRLTKLSDLTEVFPTPRFRRAPPKDRPFEGGLAAGARLADRSLDGVQHAVADEDALTEDVTLDSLPVPPRRGRLDVPLLVAEALSLAAPTRAPQRAWTRHAMSWEDLP
jgi:hypothetical protein